MPTKTAESYIRHEQVTPAISLLVRQVRSEYLEMPGLKLTEAQARRLWSMDCDTCRVVLATLVERGFLRRSARGLYIRAAR